MLDEPHVSCILLSLDKMHPEWPRVSMQPAGAKELYKRKEIWKAECYCRLQLRPVWATHRAKHKTAVRRHCLHGKGRKNTWKLLHLIWIFSSLIPATSSSVNWLSDISTGSRITSSGMSTGNVSRKPFPNVSTEPSALYQKVIRNYFCAVKSWNRWWRQSERRWCCASLLSLLPIRAPLHILIA